MTDLLLSAARERLRGWETGGSPRPSRHGLAHMVRSFDGNEAEEETAFVCVEEEAEWPAAAVLLEVTGGPDGGPVRRFSPDALPSAVEVLARLDPGARSLRAWRDLAGSVGDRDEPLLAVFDEGSPEPEEEVAVLREILATARPAAPVDRPTDLTRPGEDSHPLRRRWHRTWAAPPFPHWWTGRGTNWVRFHTLPGSKQYPDSEAEHEVIRRRQETLLAELAGATDGLLVLDWALGFRYTPSPRGPRHLFPDGQLWSVWSHVDLDPTLAFKHAYVSEVDRHSVALASRLRAVADEEAGSVVVTPPDLRWLYCPYPGGIDVGHLDPAVLDDLGERYRDWLP